MLDNTAYQDKNGDLVWSETENVHNADNRWLMLLAPRSHAKSTVFTVAYPLWEIASNQNVRIVIVSSTASQSESFLREVSTQLERNSTYKQYFGNMKPQNPEKWTDKEIIVNRTATDLKDPTISATSMGGTVLSKRADIIICDDILSKENTRTADQREKVRQWFFEVLLPVLEPNGRLIVIGTAWNTEDLYHQLMEDTSFDVRLRYQAIMNEETKQTMWSERWDYETLMTRKHSMGSLAFSQAYQNVVLSSEDAIFKTEWLKRAKERGKDRHFLQTLDYAQWDLGSMTIAAGVDLAISQKDGSDYTAIAVIGRTKDGTKIPLYLSRAKYSPAETRAAIIDMYRRFEPSIVKVENNGYQEALRRDLADTTDIPIKAYTTGGEKFDPEIGINSLAVGFENDKWILPYDKEYPSTTRLTDILCDGMLRFPSGHTEDLLMAVWFADTGLRDLKGSSSTFSVGSRELLYNGTISNQRRGRDYWNKRLDDWNEAT